MVIKTLEKMFKAGFKSGDLQVANSILKWKDPLKIKMMTGTFYTQIQRTQDEAAAAEAVFAVVKAGKF